MAWTSTRHGLVTSVTCAAATCGDAAASTVAVTTDRDKQGVGVSSLASVFPAAEGTGGTGHGTPDSDLMTGHVAAASGSCRGNVTDGSDMTLAKLVSSIGIVGWGIAGSTVQTDGMETVTDALCTGSGKTWRMLGRVG